ncbi:cell division protein ZapE [Paracoccus sp. p4-l81]|uniref:cell division protein ZapE n=1 Tax=unclassified Paracoccus (in: a-proteobacteria) TaxID=2688777 RepID=UPI0035B8A878
MTTTVPLTTIYDRRIAAGDLRGDPAQRAALAALEVVRQQLEAAPPPKAGGLMRLFARPEPPPTVPGLYIWGGVGRGKSMLMDLFFNEVAVPAKRRVHFHAFMQEVQARLNEARAKGHSDAVRPVADAIAAQARLLCFDEMQISDIADAMIVGRLFDYLFQAGTTVVTTSNRAPEDLYKNGLNRQLFLPFIALIRDRLAVHELRSDTDYRQHRLHGAQVYFTPADSRAEAELAAIWSDLTGGAAGAPRVLLVQGRDLTLARHHDGVAWARFWDLCGQPLGPADYLAIAAAVRVLILSDIPRLSSDNFNAARRFVTLIDALYEARVRLICSAADVPDRLYVEGEGAFEFERTASRLSEMQSAGWGAADALP